MSFGFLHVLQCQFPAFGKARHQQLGSAPEQSQKFIQRAVLH